MRKTMAPRSAMAAFTTTTSASAATSPSVDDGRTFDNLYEDVQIGKGDKSRRAFTYLTLGGARFMYATAGRLAVMKFIGSMSASADVLALAAMEVELGKIAEGTTVTVKWRGKPVFIRHRNPEEIAAAMETDVSTLLDKQTDVERRKEDNDKWLVVLGVCTHLGCVPLTGAGDFGGWFCPCHGSHYDTSGRIRKGPAPLNLEVPQWEFLGADKVKLG